VQLVLENQLIINQRKCVHYQEDEGFLQDKGTHLLQQEPNHLPKLDQQFQSSDLWLQAFPLLQPV